MPDTKHLLIVYHSQSGSTSRMAEAVIRGAKDPDIENVEVRVRDALEATPDDVLWADGYIFGTPENFGYMSGALKYFFDRMDQSILRHYFQISKFSLFWSIFWPEALIDFDGS